MRSMYFGRELIPAAQYRQMCGRAGRAGLVAEGESFVLARPGPLERCKARELSTAPLPRIASQMDPLRDGGRALLRVMLELIALGVCVDEEEVLAYTEQTLIFAESTASSAESALSAQDLRAEVQALICFLSAAKAVSVEEKHLNVLSSAPSSQRPDDSGCSNMRVTRFGRAVMESSLGLDEALVIYEDLLRARAQGITLESNLHLLFLVTPLQHALSPSFSQLCHVLENARQSKKGDNITLFQSIGIGAREEATMFRWTQQPPSYCDVHAAADRLRQYKIEQEKGSRNCEDNKGLMSEFECQLICKCTRLWAASALNMLVECHSPARVAETYSISGGKQLTPADVQSLAHSTTILCCRLVKFCREIGWPDFERLVEHVHSDLLSEGLSEEHRPLLGVPGVHPGLARTLVANGIGSVPDLAAARAEDLVQRMQLDVRFEAAEGLLDEPGGEEAAEMSKDDSRRHHLTALVLNLIHSARYT